MSESLDVSRWQEMISSSLQELGATVGAFVPSLLGALAILILGWVVAKLVSLVARRLLVRVGLDRAAARLGISDTLRGAHVQSDPSQILALLLFWLLMLTFVLSAAETLGLTAVTRTIDRLIAYLPHVIGAALIVVVGMVLAGFVGNLVGSAASAAGVDYARELGAAANAAIVVFAGVLAAEQLGVETALLVTALGVGAAALAAGLALAFALGARDVVSGVLASRYLRQSLVVGEEVEVDGRSGVLEQIGTMVSSFRDGDTVWSIPNGRLLNSTVVRRPRRSA